MADLKKKNIPVPKGDEQIVHQGKIVEVVEQDMQIGDKQVTFEYARRSPGTRLVIVKDKEVLLTKEYRFELEDFDYRLPGGKVFDTLEEYNQFLKSKGDLLKEAKEAAKREAEEEVGVDAIELEHFHTSKCGATVDWDLYYFIVHDFEEKEDGQNLEHGEVIETSWFSFEEARKICIEGRMQEDRSVGVLLRFLEDELN